MVEKYGKETAFFTTNCGMQPSLQAAVLDEPNAYYPQPCCPSPYHAFPATLGLELEIGGDDEDALISSLVVTAKDLTEDVMRRKLSDFEEMPEPVRQAMLILVATLYEERQVSKGKT